MSDDRSVDFPIGASISRAALEQAPYEHLAALRRDEPVSWIPDLGAWFVTRRDLVVAPAAVVLLFGAIETAEGVTANAFWHLLSHPGEWESIRNDRSRIAAAVEESLRLEPAAAVLDRYTTCDVELGDVLIPAGELVTLSLLAANRDPATFERPDEYDPTRENVRQHVTFAQGPHACLGLHLARMETVAAINALLDAEPEVLLDEAATTAPSGLIFRKPSAVWAHRANGDKRLRSSSSASVWPRRTAQRSMPALLSEH